MNTKTDRTTTNATHHAAGSRPARQRPQPTWWPGSAAYAWESRTRGPISEMDPLSSQRPAVESTRGAAAV
jgi:hypothetical protein